MSLEELTQREPFYAAMRQLTETAWRRNMTVEALLTLSDLLDPIDDAPRISSSPAARWCATSAASGAGAGSTTAEVLGASADDNTLGCG